MSQISNPLKLPCIAYFPVKARSECTAPADGALGGVVEIRRMFHAACPASQRPGARPTRGSGFGAVIETIGVTGGGITAGGGGGGVGRAPALARPLFSPCAPSGGVACPGSVVCVVAACAACGDASVFFGTNDATINMAASNPETSVTSFIRHSMQILKREEQLRSWLTAGRFEHLLHDSDLD